MVVSPVILRQAGLAERNSNDTWRPFAMWDVDEIGNSYKMLEVQQLSPSVFQVEPLYRQDIARVTAQESAALGAQSSGRRSAMEKKINENARRTRANMPVVNFRFF